MRDANFFKVPKKLIRNEQFKKLPSSSKIMIFYLLSLHNTFKNNNCFKQKPKRLGEETGLSKSTIWRSIQELKTIGIMVKKRNKNYIFNLNNFYDKYIEKQRMVSKLNNKVSK